MSNKIRSGAIGLAIVGLAIWAAVGNQATTPPARPESSDEETSTAPTSSTPAVAPSPATSSTPTTSTLPTGGSTGAKSYTLSEVSKHNSAASCWSAINGNVYDLTAWIDKHPGGPDKILGLCGQDSSAAFNKQHGGKEKQETTLATFKIGRLAN